MRHGMRLAKLGMASAKRKMFFRQQVSSLIKFDRIETTLTKAKAVARKADKIVTLAKNGDAASRLRAYGMVTKEEGLLHKLYTVMVPRYKDRQGGYTRVLRNGRRRGDNAPMAILEYVDSEKGNLLTLRKERALLAIKKAERAKAAGKPVEPQLSRAQRLKKQRQDRRKEQAKAKKVKEAAAAAEVKAQRKPKRTGEDGKVSETPSVYDRIFRSTLRRFS